MAGLTDGVYRLNDTTELRVTWDNQALADLERGPDGFVVRDLVRRGQRVQEAAQRQVRLGHVGGGPGGRGNLRYSIVKRLARDGGDLPTMLVGSENPIALLHHEGSRPHVIQARRARYLAFYPGPEGGLVFRKRVNHPGFAGNPYLVSNLNLAVQ